MSYIPNNNLISDETGYVPMQAIGGVLGGDNIYVPPAQPAQPTAPGASTFAGRFMPDVAAVFTGANASWHPVYYWMLQYKPA